MADTKVAETKESEVKIAGPTEFRVAVTVVQGRNLVKKDLRGASDPFVKITVEGKSQQTKVIKTSLAPIWKERFEFTTKTRPREVQLECLDWNRILKNAPMGNACIDITPIWQNPEHENGEYRWVPLKLDGIKSGGNAGDIQVQVEVSDKPVIPEVRYDSFTHLIELTIQRGHELNADLVGKACYAYCQVEFGGHLFRTAGSTELRNPQWGSTIFLWLDQKSQGTYKILFSIKDEDPSRDVARGFVYFPVQEILEHPEIVERELELIAHKAKTDADLEKEKEKPAAVDAKLGKLCIKTSLFKKEDVEKKWFNDLFTEFHQLTAGDGDQDPNSLDSAEATFMFESVGIHMTEEMFNELDRDKSGKISRDELAAYLESPKAQKSAEKLLLYIQHKENGEALGGALMEGFTRKAEVGQIAVKDLETGNIVFENIPGYIKAALHVMSDTKVSRLVTSHAVKLMKNLSKKQGIKYDNPHSVKDIPGFIKLHRLNVEEMELAPTEYKTFNEFFARKLKAGARPVDTPDDSKRAVSPADSRMMVFEDFTVDTSKWIKGAKFTIENLLAAEGKEYVEKLQGGSLVIARLAPQDYHRWHVPVKGTLGRPIPIDGALYTVNPIAINHAVNVYTENKRVLIPIQSEEFGLVMLVAVGAIMVGSIVVEGKEGEQVQKGALHGYFKFGGSTVLVLFQKNRIKFRQELLDNSKDCTESLIKCGGFLGTATQPGKKD